MSAKFVHLGNVEFTENAQVKQHIIPVNSRIQGFIKEVRFDEYAQVKHGAPRIPPSRGAPFVSTSQYPREGSKKRLKHLARPAPASKILFLHFACCKKHLLFLLCKITYYKKHLLFPLCKIAYYKKHLLFPLCKIAYCKKHLLFPLCKITYCKKHLLFLLCKIAYCKKHLLFPLCKFTKSFYLHTFVTCNHEKSLREMPKGLCKA